MYLVTKTYGHDLGLSACFRQWRAKSHCQFLHGYPLSFKFTFGAQTLDENNWVINFGGLKEVKAWLEQTFDHKMVVAQDDPELDTLTGLALLGLAQPIVLPYVGCEGFARYAFEHVTTWLYENKHSPRVSLLECEVREHGGNSAIYKRG